MTVTTPPEEHSSLEGSESPVETDGAPPRAWWAAWFRRLLFFLSPADQPFWARPALLVVAAGSAFMYAWQSSGYLEIYYAAAVRSMSMSWHNFLYSAFDPAGTVSTDKLPGAFWVQALSVRIFGLHDWAIVLPQIIEGTLTVLVLYRVVRRLAGPVAGIAAAVIFAVAPANVALNRGNISDTLMILLLVLAADATVGALKNGRIANLVLAALWVGLAFQAKMLEAWLILPALGIVYLIAAPSSLRKRILGLAVLGVVAVAVSLSWMIFVTLQPESGRPYIDGSHNDSIFQQVFEYNGFGRLSQPSPNEVLFETIGLGNLASTPPGWDRMLTGPFGLDTGWLIPASAAALGFGLVARRRKPRGDPLRASLVLWGTWLAALIAVFSVSTTINSYYTAALTPAIAGLVATGLGLVWEHRRSVLARLVVVATVLGTTAYAAWLLPSNGIGLPGWLATATIVAGCAAAFVVLASIWIRRPRQVLGAVLALGVASALVVPAVASASVVSNGLGSFDTPFEPAQYALGTKALFGPATRQTAKLLLPELEKLKAQFHTPYLMATQTAVLGAPTIFESGQEVYPLGGYNGTGVSPTLAKLESLVAKGAFHIVLASPKSTDPRYRWIEQHCRSVGGHGFGGFGIYFCGTLKS
jgi:4-amino-4-deoxy-L-arabinose transferase-like glycosyltransferase